jgi:hypothetical protein
MRKLPPPKRDTLRSDEAGGGSIPLRPRPCTVEKEDAGERSVGREEEEGEEGAMIGEGRPKGSSRCSFGRREAFSLFTTI